MWRQSRQGDQLGQRHTGVTGNKEELLELDSEGWEGMREPGKVGAGNEAADVGQGKA